MNLFHFLDDIKVKQAATTAIASHTNIVLFHPIFSDIAPNPYEATAQPTYAVAFIMPVTVAVLLHPANLIGTSVIII